MKKSTAICNLPEPSLGSLLADHASSRFINGIKRVSIFEAEKVLENRPGLISTLPMENIFQWVSLGDKIIREPGLGIKSGQEYFLSGLDFLSDDNIGFLAGWVKSGLQIANYSLDAADEFFRSTPVFLKQKRMHSLSWWAGIILDFIRAEEVNKETAPGFIRSGAVLLQYMPHREFNDWRDIGRMLAEHSPALSTMYYDSVPEGLDSIYILGQRNFFKVVRLMARTDPADAAMFYQNGPSALAPIKSGIKEKVLEAMLIPVADRAEKRLSIFDSCVSVLPDLTFKVQEGVMEHVCAIGELSVSAALSFLTNSKEISEAISIRFIPEWVGKGLEILAGDKEQGKGFFSLQTEAAREELERWKSAVLFEDVRDRFSIFAHALCGKKVKPETAEEEEREKGFSGQLWWNDQPALRLPPYYAFGKNRDENICLYKTAAAQQAGYMEFGTFTPEFILIWNKLGAFPIPSLARDIFFILEDGRIMRMLGKNYRGLKPEIKKAAALGLANRPCPDTNPVIDALEFLLGRAMDIDRDNAPSSGKGAAYSFLEKEATEFYERAHSVTDSYITAARLYEYFSRLGSAEEYISITPLPHQLWQELEEFGSLALEADRAEGEDDEEGGWGSPLSPPDEVLDLFRHEDGIDPNGAYITELDCPPTIDEAVEPEDEPEKRPAIQAVRLIRESASPNGPLEYHEWDYVQGMYLRRWCLLYEEALPVDSASFYDETRAKHHQLIRNVRKHFQRIRPAVLEPVRAVEWGDEIDMNELVRWEVERRSGRTPLDNIFSRKEKRLQRISILLLVDMSASTEDLAVTSEGDEAGEGIEEGKPDQDLRIIDIFRESLVIMMEALNALGSSYGVFGFSGQGRKKVESFVIKEFGEAFSDEVKGRVGSIKPKQSTRMGCAVRHAAAKMRRLDADRRLLLLLSDGFPQDMDYGDDRKSNDYALRDTMMAFAEARKAEIRPFCITIDQSANDYLKNVSDPSSHLVMRDVHSLPQVLPKVVESLMD